MRKTILSLAFLAGCQSVAAVPQQQRREVVAVEKTAPIESDSIWAVPARQAGELVQHIWREEGVQDGIRYVRGENNDKTADFMDPLSGDWYKIQVRLDHGLEQECSSDWCENALRIEVMYARGGHPTIVIDNHMDGSCDRAFDSGLNFDQNPMILQNKYESLVRRLNEIYRALPKDERNPSH